MFHLLDPALGEFSSFSIWNHKKKWGHREVSEGKHVSESLTELFSFLPEDLGNADPAFLTRMSGGEQYRHPGPQLRVGLAAMLVY